MRKEAEILYYKTNTETTGNFSSPSKIRLLSRNKKNIDEEAMKYQSWRRVWNKKKVSLENKVHDFII